MFYIIKLLLDNSNSDLPNLEVSLSESMKNFLYFVLRYSFCGCCGSPGYSQTGYVTECGPWITESPASFTQELESPACGTTIQFILFYKKKRNNFSEWTSVLPSYWTPRDHDKALVTMLNRSSQTKSNERMKQISNTCLLKSTAEFIVSSWTSKAEQRT